MARRFALALAAALASSPAHAAETLGVLAVGDPPAGPSAELADLARSFHRALAETHPGVVSPDLLRARMESRGATASLSELDRAFNGAVVAFQAADYERSVRTLRAVIEDLERLPPSERAFGTWMRAMMRLARAEGSLGHKREAHDAIERLLRADPAATADPDLYPPSFAQQIDAVRSELRAKPRRKLVVSAGGARARIYVEGRFAGEAPLTLHVPAGRYRVAGLLRDVFSAQATADLSAEDQTVALDFTLGEVMRPAGGPGLAVAPARRATSAVAAGAALMLDRVFALSLVVDGDVRYVVGSSYDVRKGSLQREGRVRLSGETGPERSLSALATFLQTGEPSALVITRPAAGPERMAIAPAGPDAEEARRSSNRLLRWSPVATGGLAAVLGGIALWQGLSAPGRYDDAKSMLASSGGLTSAADRAAFDRLVSDGDAAKRNATISGVGAATALAATAVLSYVSYKRSGEVGPFRFGLGSPSR